MIHLEVHNKPILLKGKELIHTIECVSFVYHEDTRMLGIFMEFDNTPSYWIVEVTKIECFG